MFNAIFWSIYFLVILAFFIAVPWMIGMPIWAAILLNILAVVFMVSFIGAGVEDGSKANRGTKPRV